MSKDSNTFVEGFWSIYYGLGIFSTHGDYVACELLLGAMDLVNYNLFLEKKIKRAISL